MQLCACAGETSGDEILSPIIDSLQKEKSIRSSGIAGPKMIQSGVYPLFPMEHLAVMGIMEVLPRLPLLFSIRKKMKEYLDIARPAVLLTCDAPDFNLALCEFAKRREIPSYHVVSPSVWAWRSERIPKIAKQLDGLLCLFPFEPDLYRGTGLKTTFIGHPLASKIKFNPDPAPFRKVLGLPAHDPILAILPGSRKSELKMLFPLFLNVFDKLRQKIPNLTGITPIASQFLKDSIITKIGSRPIHVLNGQAQDAIAASSAVLVGSGTAVLEASLTGRPAVAAYRMQPMSYFWIKRRIKSKFITLPNVMANKALIAEFVQDEATVKNLSYALGPLLTDGPSQGYLGATKALHDNLAGPVAERASNWLIDQWDL